MLFYVMVVITVSEAMPRAGTPSDSNLAGQRHPEDQSILPRFRFFKVIAMTIKGAGLCKLGQHRLG